MMATVRTGWSNPLRFLRERFGSAPPLPLADVPPAPVADAP
jgi:hypothetical protein